MRKIIFQFSVLCLWVFDVQAACPPKDKYQAVDLSRPVNQVFLNKMAELGINTIIRYYDHPQETIRGKTLKRSERDLIARNRFKLITVFQHNSGSLRSFTEDRAQRDADRSLHLAQVVSQPRGSAIYFGVDNNWKLPAEIAKIKTYFRKASPQIRAAGFKMGGYGSGLVCKELLDSGLVDYCWLSNATSWPEHDEFLRSKRWTLKQFPHQMCSGLDADFNFINPLFTDVGGFF